MEKEIFVVTVTYGNRYKYLHKVIESVTAQGIANVIVVDNNSDDESYEKLLKLKENNECSITILRQQENTGSAVGFSTGMRYASQNRQCNYIWVIDDDNEPRSNALNELITEWQNVIRDNPLDNTALVSYREIHDWYKTSTVNNDLSVGLGKNNCFNKLHFTEIANKILTRIFKIKRMESELDSNLGQVSMVPYGGMFFSKELLNKIGYPNNDFFLYMDDTDFSYRITKGGGHIFVVFSSIIDDIDTVYSDESAGKSALYNYLNTMSDRTVYYYIRNRVYFEKQNLVTNSVVRNINKFLFIFLMNLYNLKYKRFQRYDLIRRAIADGENGQLGKIELD